MSQFKTIVQELNYDLAGGAINFAPQRIESGDTVTAQVFYSGLDAADLNLRLQQSLDESVSDFNDVLDAGGNEVESVLDNTETSFTFNITSLETDWARMIIQAIGAVTAGIITKIIWRIGK